MHILTDTSAILSSCNHCNRRDRIPTTRPFLKEEMCIQLTESFQILEGHAKFLLPVGNSNRLLKKLRFKGL